MFLMLETQALENKSALPQVSALKSFCSLTSKCEDWDQHGPNKEQRVLFIAEKHLQDCSFNDSKLCAMDASSFGVALQRLKEGKFRSNSNVKVFWLTNLADG